jgi:hypothetical protein
MSEPLPIPHPPSPREQWCTFLWVGPPMDPRAIGVKDAPNATEAEDRARRQGPGWCWGTYDPDAPGEPSLTLVGRV